MLTLQSMFCPQCRAEYREGFNTCNQCEIALVDDLVEVQDDFQSIEASLDKTSLKPFLIGPLHRLREAQSLLQKKGIASMVGTELADELIESGVHDRVYLLLEEAQLEAAEKTLGEAWQAGLVKEGITNEAFAAGVEGCPACGTELPADQEECAECGLFVGRAEDIQE